MLQSALETIRLLKQQASTLEDVLELNFPQTLMGVPNLHLIEKQISDQLGQNQDFLANRHIVTIQNNGAVPDYRSYIKSEIGAQFMDSVIYCEKETSVNKSLPSGMRIQFDIGRNSNVFTEQYHMHLQSGAKSRLYLFKTREKVDVLEHVNMLDVFEHLAHDPRFRKDLAALPREDLIKAFRLDELQAVNNWTMLSKVLDAKTSLEAGKLYVLLSSTLHAKPVGQSEGYAIRAEVFDPPTF